MTRIALIHALHHSQEPIEAAFAAIWPEAQLTNILDDSLSRDLAEGKGLDGKMTARLMCLSRYAVGNGAEAILFTCSAFGPCIEAVRAELAPLPVRGPSESMIAEAVAIPGRVALVATFAPTLRTMPNEFPPSVELEPIFVDGALAALNAGEPDTHDRLIVEALTARRFDVVALAQFSMARAAPAVADRFRLPVLTTPAAAARELRTTLERSLKTGEDQDPDLMNCSTWPGATPRYPSSV